MTDATPAPAALRALLDDIAREQDYRDHRVAVSPLSTGGGNYTSELFLVTVSAPGRPDLRLFAKVAIINGKMRDEAPAIAKLYETERFVYGTLVDVYGKLEEKSSVPAEHRLYFPKYYGCVPKVFEETIVLEDLGARGFGTHDRLQSIHWEYAAAAVTELAKFHALSFAYERDDPEEYARVLSERKYEFSSSDAKMKTVWEGMVRGAVGACREQHRARLARFLAEHGSKLRDYYAPLRRPVLTHGDYRPSNLMHRVTQEGSLRVVGVDWQTVRAGCAATDLLYLVFAGSDKAFRARHYSQLVDEYHRQLAAALRRLTIDVDTVYSREDFDYELKQSLPYGLLLAVFVLPLVTVEAAHAPRIDDMAEDWHVKTGALFSDRLNDVVDDYVAWGVL